VSVVLGERLARSTLDEIFRQLFDSDRGRYFRVQYERAPKRLPVLTDSSANLLSSRNMSKSGGIQYWLLTTGRHAASFQDLVQEYSRLLTEAGIPVDRIFIGTKTLHPQTGALRLKWERSLNGEQDDKYAECDLAYTVLKEMEVFDWEATGGMPPFAQMEFRQKPQVRVRVEAGDDIPKDCHWLIDEKYTDYIALPDNYGKDRGFDAGYAWSTKIPGGFAPEHIEYLIEHMPALSTVVRLLANDYVTKTLLVTYLGREPGSRVYTGSIHRGDGVTIRSVLWFSDVRGFTAMSNRLSRRALIQVINTVFEVTECAIRKHGGEVLKLMGDGLSKWQSVRSARRIRSNQPN
jgi:adenylate cyclase